MRVIAVTQAAFLRMKRAGIAVGAPLEQEDHWSEVMSNRYEFREKRVRDADLIAIWALLAAVFLVAVLWSFV